MDPRIVVNTAGKWEIWEAGGGMSNTGSAQIICGPKGEMLQSVFVRTRGDLSNREHAKFLAKPGDVVITADYQRHIYAITMERIREDGTIEPFFVEEEGMVKRGKIEDKYHFFEAVRAACNKAECYHCRETHYSFTKFKLKS
ncbi:MAG: hypothetical protein WC302_02090 [Candidatus Paceibacterota bacterium]|jgi:hypothetical protein